ncbi:flagellar basal body-associated FliL family protein [Lutispora thermophila]|uniref:Flagellar protein FliL n=1 Tax=Lutispora thermophila DSM 19022 TaxID=1122184 RepID=A0A1M6G786_9FIRM|nr:flagellar basal body-associated FliL family protein [Lutispora thermophila]SHJ05825.1 flagellar FliL protein [Lutispora thermophila DSM 19022]
MKKNNILLIIVVVLLIVVIALGVALITAQSNSENDESIKVNKNITMYSFDQSFVSNVKDSNKILKVTVQLELANSKVQEIISARNPELRHEINLLLRSKTEEDLKGAEGQSNLQKEILSVVRKLLNSDKILNVYFDEFIMQ